MTHETLVVTLEVMGVVLALIGLLVAFLVYYLDIRKALTSIQARQKSALRDFNVDLRNGLWGLVRDQEGVLSHFQANHLLEIYLDEVSMKLGNALDHYAQNDFGKHFTGQQKNLILHELERAYDAVVRKSVRPMFSPFRLRANVMFDDIVAAASSKFVKLAFQKISDELDRAQSTQDIGAFLAFVRHTMMQTGEDGRRVIRKHIQDLYAHSDVYWEGVSRETLNGQRGEKREA